MVSERLGSGGGQRPCLSPKVCPHGLGGGGGGGTSPPLPCPQKALDFSMPLNEEANYPSKINHDSEGAH